MDLLRRETAASPDRMARALAGLRAYQRAERRPRDDAMPVVARAGSASLRDYGGDGPAVVFVPSLINPPFVLDLEGASLLRWLAAQGVRPLLVDWGHPSPADRDLDIGGHVTQRLLPLIGALGEPPVLVGYCLGGTMAMAAAALRPVRALALIASPWHFSGFSDAARADMTALWHAARPAAEAMGLVPMEVLQAGFWQLDPARTVSKYERFVDLDPASEQARAFVALEDWSNGGAPLSFAAGRQLFEDFVTQDTPGAGRWQVDGTVIDPAAIACPSLDIVSANDRIVPAATAARLPDTRTLNAGHVGMIVGGRARDQLWSPLAAWLSQLHNRC